MAEPTHRQTLVMLIKLADGKVGMLDANGSKVEVASADEMWKHAQALLADASQPQLSSSPAAGPTVQQKRQEQKLEEAFGTLGTRLREVAEAEYGAPLVEAASTVVGHATRTTTGFLKRLSRKKGSRPRRVMRRA